MDIELIKENDDGSADFHINLSDQEQADLIRFAFIEMLKRGIEEGKKYDVVAQRDWIEELKDVETDSSLQRSPV
jgi:hypothetical protein